ncbi:MAG: RNA 2',3'-cyclic phosphodiesterase [Bdellovibrionales bacterium]
MAHYFLAIPIQAEDIEGLGKDLKKLRIYADKREYNIRWIALENYHLTLSFYGKLSENEIEQIKLDMENFGSNKFQIDLRDVSAFPTPERARVVYLGARRSQALVELKNLLDEKIQVPPENKEDFVPHITLARLRSFKHIVDFISPVRRKRYNRLVVDRVSLYKSTNAKNFSLYEEVFTVHLDSK